MIGSGTSIVKYQVISISRWNEWTAESIRKQQYRQTRNNLASKDGCLVRPYPLRRDDWVDPDTGTKNHSPDKMMPLSSTLVPCRYCCSIHNFYSASVAAIRYVEFPWRLVSVAFLPAANALAPFHGAFGHFWLHEWHLGCYLYGFSSTWMVKASGKEIFEHQI